MKAVTNLRNLIHAEEARPSFIVSHRIGLDEAPGKVVLKPSQNGAAARA
jgi:hypothetical protein